MFESQYLHSPKGEGESLEVYSPWFGRGGDHARFTVDIVQVIAATLQIEVLTKNSETAGDGGTTLVLSSLFTSFGQYEIDPTVANSTLELVRYKFKVVSTGTEVGSVLFRMLPPVWFDSVKV
jgi:hypothetical protein